jgi:hypothetical protein
MNLISAGSISLDSTFKGLSKDGGRWIFLKTYRASIFNEDQSNEPNFGWIYLLDNTFKSASTKLKSA